LRGFNPPEPRFFPFPVIPPAFFAASVLPDGNLFQFHIKALSALARLRLLNIHFSTPRSLNPRRFEIILDLELVLFFTEK
jgi:hypothetical protein